jgi:hypothetical protein
MSYNFVIQTEAILDIQEAFEWYEKKHHSNTHFHYSIQNTL